MASLVYLETVLNSEGGPLKDTWRFEVKRKLKGLPLLLIWCSLCNFLPFGFGSAVNTAKEAEDGPN